MSGLALVAKIVVVIALAALIGIAVTTIGALVGHEVLVAIYGESGIAAIDDTLPMFLAVSTAYAAGFLAGVAVIFIGWRRVVRR